MRPAVLVVALIALSLALASCSVKTSFKAGDTSSTDDTGGSADAGKDGGKEAASGPSVVAMRVGD
ncbi:MAG: hypothetical protein FJX74_09900, partial [Armatimonadetes bacterium]|nr:hypothetical protein [Armatimonadota bacterium]